jgi:hypothetical protein
LRRNNFNHNKNVLSWLRQLKRQLQEHIRNFEGRKTLKRIDNEKDEKDTKNRRIGFMPKCPNCNENVPKRQRFCGYCGTDVTTGERPEDLAFFNSLTPGAVTEKEEESFFAKQRKAAIAAGQPVVETPKPKVEIPPEIAKEIKGKNIDETEIEMRMKGVWQQDSQSQKIAEKLKGKENDIEIAVANQKKNKEFLKDLPPIGIPQAPAPTGKPPEPVVNKPVVNKTVEKNVPPIEIVQAIQPEQPVLSVQTVPPTQPTPKPQKDVPQAPKNQPPQQNSKYVSKFDAFDNFVPKSKKNNIPNDYTGVKNGIAPTNNQFNPPNQLPKNPPPVGVKNPPPPPKPPLGTAQKNIVESAMSALKKETDNKKDVPPPVATPKVEEVAADNAVKIAVPDVVNQTKEDAKAMLNRLGLKVTLKTVNDDAAPKGIIVSQDIEVGEKVEENTVLTLLVSVGNWSKWTKDPYLSDEKHEIESKTIYRYRSREKYVEYKESDKNTMVGFDLYDSKKQFSNWDTDKYYSKEARLPSDTCEILKMTTGFKYFGWTYCGIESIPTVYCSLEMALYFNPQTKKENWEYNETIDDLDAEAELEKWIPEGGFEKNPAGDDVVSNISFVSYYVSGIEYSVKTGTSETVWTKYRKRKLENVTYLFKAERFSEWGEWSEWSLEPEIEADELHNLESQTLYRRRRKADVSI